MTRWNRLIGTGGIGSGVLFTLDSDRPLGRDESRPGRLSEACDYCKQHIILHYIAQTLSKEMEVRAIGMVGSDAQGRELLERMRAVGINTDGVLQTDRAPTMFSACMQYPDKSVCNVTSSNSACAMVDARHIAKALHALQRPLDQSDVVLAAPEVPLEARMALLQAGKRAGAFCVSSFTADEAKAALLAGMLRASDLLSINAEEAASLTGCGTGDHEALMRALAALAREQNDALRLVMTCGAAGCLCAQEGRMQRVPAIPQPVRTTAGAGDALLAGTVCGLALGLPFLSDREMCAPALGVYFASESIQDINTITQRITREGALGFINEGKIKEV